MDRLSTLCSEHSSKYSGERKIDWFSKPNAIHFHAMKTPIVTGKDQFDKQFFSFALEFDTKDKTGVWTIFESPSSSSSFVICGDDSFDFLQTSLIGEKDKERFFEKITSLVSGEWIQLEKSGEPQYVRLSKKKTLDDSDDDSDGYFSNRVK